MHAQLNPRALFATLILSTSLASCDSSVSTRPFGDNLSSTASLGSGASTTEEEQAPEQTSSTTTPPEAFPVPTAKTVDINNRAHANFEIDESGVAYLVVNNPSQQNFDSWLMDEAEYQDYETARFGLPQSANPSHQNYKAQYGISLSSSMVSGIPVNTNLLAGNYHIVIDNTELGDNNNLNIEAISYSFAVFIGTELQITSEDVD